jgi:hypothetical protein
MSSEKEIKIEDIYGIIYRIKCIQTQKNYIGQTLSHHLKNRKWEPYGIENRLIKHLSRSTLSEYPLYNDIKKYGFDNFEVTEEEILKSEKIIELNLLEKKYIDEYKSLHPNGYNLTTNTEYIDPDKKIIFDYYNLEIKNSSEHIERQMRRKQVSINCNSESKRLEFFKDKNIEKIYINPIKEGEKYKYIRVLIYIEKIDDIFRVQFSNKDIKEAIDRAFEFSNKLTKKIEYNPSIINIKNDNLEDEYKYQEKINKIGEDIYKISKITGSFFYHKSIDKKTYLVLISFEASTKRKSMRIMFGGKKIEENDAYNMAKEFVDKINNINKVESVILKQ